jgi:hypothetical protein
MALFCADIMVEKTPPRWTSDRDQHGRSDLSSQQHSVLEINPQHKSKFSAQLDA